MKEMSEAAKFVQTVGKELMDEGDSPAGALKRFYGTVVRLFKLAQRINVDIKPAPRIPPGLMGLAVTLVESIGEDGIEPIMTTFADRACPLVEKIKANDLDTFKKNAKDIFSGAPTSAIDAVTQVIDDDSVPPEKLAEVFVLVHAMFRMSMKRNAMIVYEESLLGVASTIDVDVLKAAIESFGIFAPK